MELIGKTAELTPEESQLTGLEKNVAIKDIDYLTIFSTILSEWQQCMGLQAADDDDLTNLERASNRHDLSKVERKLKVVSDMTVSLLRAPLLKVELYTDSPLQKTSLPQLSPGTSTTNVSKAA